MRVGLIYLNKGGGIGQYTYMLAKELAAKTDLTCYMVDNPYIDDFKALPCKVKVYDFRRGYKSLITSTINGGECKNIAQDIITDSPDVIIDPGSLLWSPVIQRQLGRKIPFIEVVHDANPHPDYRYLPFIIYRHLYPSIADAIITLSEYCYNQEQKIYPKKHHILSRHGIIVKNESVSPEQVASNRHKMLFFGLIKAYKGLDTLVDAYAIVKQTNPDIEVKIVGQGRISRSLLQRINELGIDLVNEYVSEDYIKELFATHGVSLMPYTSGTQSGVASVTIGNGLPGIATNVGALPEQIRDGINGIIVPKQNPKAFAAAMIDIASDYEKALNMSRESLKLATTEYSWGQIGNKLIEDINDLFKVIKKT